MIEHVVIIARRVVEEIEVRISRTVDRPQPIGSAELEVELRRRITQARRPRARLLLAAPKAA